MMKGGAEVRDVEAERTRRMKKREGYGKEETKYKSSIDVKYVGIKDC